MGIVDLLRAERSFRFVWLSQVVSEAGDWFQIVAIFSMFPTAGRGSAVLAGLYVARYVFATLVMPIAGVVADRFHRGRVMILADLGRMLVTLGFLLVHGPEDIALVFVLSLLLEGMSAFFEPARGAAIPQVVPPGGLLSANLLSGATWSALLGLGSMAGGVTTSLLGRKAAFAINAVSFALSAVFVKMARIPPLPPQEEGTRAPHPLRDLSDGFVFLRKHPAQAALLVAKPGALLAGGYLILVSVFADRVFGGDVPMTMGLLLAGRGTGALFFPFLMMRIFGRDVRGVMRALVFAFPLSVVAFCVFSSAPTAVLASLALVVAHGGTSTAWTGSAQLLQLTVPNRVLGRVLSVELALVTMVVAIAGTAVGALLGAGLAPRTVAFVLALSLLVPGAVWIASYKKYAAVLEKAASPHR